MSEPAASKIGIQSNVWGPDYHAAQLPQMLAEIAAAGYDGIEIGAHRIEDLDRPNDFREKVTAQGLHVSGIHTLGKFYFEEVQAGELGYLTRAADFTRAVGCRYVLASGEPGDRAAGRDDAQLAGVLNWAGEICRARGLTYCYHNHWWEIENGQEELRALLDLTDPDLVSLCLDIGWVERAGASPAAVTTEFLDRIGYMHVKDTRQDAFTDLGEGTVDFAGVLAVVRGRPDIYLTVERDEVLPNAYESARACREYLRQFDL